MFTLNVDAEANELAEAAKTQFAELDERDGTTGEDRAAFSLLHDLLARFGELVAVEGEPFNVVGHFETPDERSMALTLAVRTIPANELEGRRNDAVAPAELAGDEPDELGQEG